MATATATRTATPTAIPTAIPGGTGHEVPHLTLVSGGDGPSAATYRRRRLVVLAGFVSFVLGLTLLFGNGGAEAELTDRVAGHEVVAPGETLWDVAVATAPAGVDVRDQLAAIIELNGLTGGDVPAWTVVLIPHR